jgi:hypothetical protein
MKPLGAAKQYLLGLKRTEQRLSHQQLGKPKRILGHAALVLVLENERLKALRLHETRLAQTLDKLGNGGDLHR